MLAEEKKFLSIPKAIGLFLIFHALFYRNQSSGFNSTNSFESFAVVSNEVSFYTFLGIGLILCYKFNKILLILIGVCFTSTLFGYTQIIVNSKISQTQAIITILTHIAIYSLLIWSYFKIVKIKLMLEKLKKK
ncbi:MAG: hypothetical protein NE330_00990 [Lentisphaeraceae bacterium]|nr:hypothetical protein [Lentisphaeraceae bacterium]